VPVATRIVAVATFAAGTEHVAILSELELCMEMCHSLENWTSSDVPLVAWVHCLGVAVEHTREQVSRRFGEAFQSQNLWS
jgi:hypothetical protein